MKSTKWKKFARVAEAIESVRKDSAVVKWNSRLAGGRFDVVIRSTYENHEFVIVVSCLDADARTGFGGVISWTRYSIEGQTCANW